MKNPYETKTKKKEPKTRYEQFTKRELYRASQGLGQRLFPNKSEEKINKEIYEESETMKRYGW